MNEYSSTYSLETLDAILTYLNKPIPEYEPIEQIRIQMDQKYMLLLPEGIQKLVSDGYVVAVEFTHAVMPFIGYSITMDGKVFCEQGGYVQQKKKQDAEITRTWVINYAIAITGGVAALYYLFEIARVYVIPVVQYYCNCHFVWQK